MVVLISPIIGLLIVYSKNVLYVPVITNGGLGTVIANFEMLLHVSSCSVLLLLLSLAIHYHNY